MRVPYGMGRTTVYLPDELDQRLAAEAQAQGVSKGELIRRGVTKLLDESQRARQAKPFPVFHSGRSRSVDELHEALVEQIAERAARR
ncbi:MAG TPA: CopG family transcriptional regulator [Gordonia sp. (in: high G+C Gram-positive bacteria)]|nr:CopG family transcriptional regulator [Gordonia sp. (in: high G+C Gram-positive bacteria)]